jgi:hypothetical protein
LVNNFCNYFTCSDDLSFTKESTHFHITSNLFAPLWKKKSFYKVVVACLNLMTFFFEFLSLESWVLTKLLETCLSEWLLFWSLDWHYFCNQEIICLTY